jgi:nucleoid-associated protein YgaU
MSSITATRTGRFTPPPAPTRKPVQRRRVTGAGAGVVGRADRPVLRIVASQPPVEPRSPSVEPVETTETPRRVALGDFFAPEYDGDDVSLQVARPRPSSVRLTRRGRLVVLGAGLAAALGFGLLGASHALAGDQPEQTRVVTVQPDQTLWDIASRAAARTGAGDTRSMMSHLEALNHLDSDSLQVGQHLRVPQ